MKRTLLVLLAAIPVALALLGAGRDVGTGYQLENVEVLDASMTLPEARRYMIQFNEALNVQCRDCHDLKDFASDAKELKLAAREMMKMQLEINEEWFPEQETEAVTCWTCHQGSRVPAATSAATGLLSLPPGE